MRGQSRRHRHRQCSQPTRAQRKPPSCEPTALRGEAHKASAHRETICFSHTAAAQAAPSSPEGHSEGAFASGEGESPRRHVLTRRLRNRDWGRIAQWRPNPAQHRLTRTSRSVNLPGRGSNRKQKSAPANRAEGAPRRLPRGRRSARLLTYPPAWVAERAVPTARAAPPDKSQCVRAGARTRVCIRRRNAYSSKWYAGGRRFDWVRPLRAEARTHWGNCGPSHTDSPRSRMEWDWGCKCEPNATF